MKFKTLNTFKKAERHLFARINKRDEQEKNKQGENEDSCPLHKALNAADNNLIFKKNKDTRKLCENLAEKAISKEESAVMKNEQSALSKAYEILGKRDEDYCPQHSELKGLSGEDFIKESPPLKTERHNEGKVKYGLIPHEARTAEAEVWTWAESKYPPVNGVANWRLGGEKATVQEAIESAYRHLNAIERGEYIDPESNLAHSGHLKCNSSMLHSYLIRDEKISK